MSVQVKLLSSKAIMPKQGTEQSAGFDLYAPERVDIPSGASYLVDTDVSMSIPVVGSVRSIRALAWL